jgi:hypothetical protein
MFVSNPGPSGQYMLCDMSWLLFSISQLTILLKFKQDNASFGTLIATQLRRGSGYRKAGQKRALTTVKNTIQQHGIFDSSIRVNHVGGANGHAGHRHLTQLRKDIMSPLTCLTCQGAS